MASTTFDTQAAVLALRDSGLDEGPAIAIVNTLRDALGTSLDEVSTKADLEATVAELRADLVPRVVDPGRGSRRHPDCSRGVHYHARQGALSDGATRRRGYAAVLRGRRSTATVAATSTLAAMNAGV